MAGPRPCRFDSEREANGLECGQQRLQQEHAINQYACQPGPARGRGGVWQPQREQRCSDTPMGQRCICVDGADEPAPASKLQLAQLCCLLLPSGLPLL